MKVFTADAVPGRPYWWDHVAWPTLGERPPNQTEILIIGAGYTGLSAAIAANASGARVLVIDSGQPGQGASTRNGGMLGAHPRIGWDTLASRYGPSVADALFSEAADALSWIKKLLRNEKIACDYEECGRVQLAYTSDHFAAQKRMAAQISEKGGGPCEILSRDELSNYIATPLYKGAIRFPKHGALHPAKYLHGLLSAVLSRKITVVSNCPAVSVQNAGTKWRVSTPHGEITADKIVLATNGYTGQQFQWFNQRVFPVPSFIIATEPLSPELIKELAPSRHMMVETRTHHSYFRVSPDGSRILFGGRAALVDIDLTKAARRLRKKMVEIWPGLRDVQLSHVWTGNTGFTFDQLPHVGDRNGVHYALGYSGGGTVLAPWLGRKAALRAVGSPEGETAFTHTRFSSRWFHSGGRPHFLRPLDLWYRHWVDRREDKTAND
ncbi:NAD(P)/FAD-dependent oxidoreductase [Ruegeria arenilitoris]|uniref:NAD(P)/FAD-dependent oxidoreductase n=1 Tax=Ruegeria arenilitoris TaxID=1173585 RepID=UPI00147BC123|nr:FAD-binding oxidoreductase [Ruegeria arenilitoris]